MKKCRLLWQLFSQMFLVSAFTFGGGYVMVPIMTQRFSQKLNWLEEDEMLELAALAQSSPGAMAINAAVLVGWRMAGLPGAIVSALGSAFPPLIILTAVCWCYELISENRYVSVVLHGMQAGIAAVIADVVYGMAKPFAKKDKGFEIAVMLLAFAATWFFGVNVIVILLAAIALGVGRWLWEKRRKAV